MTKAEMLARQIAQGFEDDITDRRGLGQEWDQIDNTIKQEIRNTWIKMIMERFAANGVS